MICLLLALVDALRVGLGKADLTGPIGEIGGMGYAHLSQLENGIHFRLYARAAIIGDNSNRIVLVSTDTGMMSNRAKAKAIELVNNPLYTVKNVMVSATHTHSGPGGYLDEFLYQATTFGIVPEVRASIAQGIANAIKEAHLEFEKSLDTEIEFNQGKLYNASVNRSPSAYLANPKAERDLFDGDVDTTMTVLTFKDASSKMIKGLFSWFPVHPVSMNNTNGLVSGDNKGFSSYLLELEAQQKGIKKFIAAFPQSNGGDVSPNINGPKCSDTGLPCDGSKTSCPDGKGKFYITKCYAQGPGNSDNFLSTKIIGTRSARAADKISTTKGKSIQGSVQSRHAWIDMSNIEFNFNGTKVKTCKPAMGQSFAAGTTDGPGEDAAYQGIGPVDPGFQFLSHLVGFALTPFKHASKELADCHAPKSVLLATGEYNVPYQWQPTVLPIQMFLVGRKFVVLGFPAEITTMAGRRLSATVLKQLQVDGTVDNDATVVISALANNYASYVTTYEEYQVQRYEAGSTVYGQHTLGAFQDQFKKLAQSFKNSYVSFPQVVLPRVDKEWTLNNDAIHKVYFDDTPKNIQGWDWSCFCYNLNFGLAITQPPSSAKIGNSVKASFHCAHPRNHRIGTSFMSIEKKQENGQWSQVMDDSVWDTKFEWKRTGGPLSATSICELEWSIGETIPVKPGVYRFKLYGTRKDGRFPEGWNLFSFAGESSPIQVSN